MDTKSLIERVIASGVLLKELIELPRCGASDFELESVEERNGVKIDKNLRDFLRLYDGANLDVIRFYSCDRLKVTKHGLSFADDP